MHPVSTAKLSVPVSRLAWPLKANRPRLLPSYSSITHIYRLQPRRGLISTESPPNTESPPRSTRQSVALQGLRLIPTTHSLINVKAIPAPHCGHIRVVSLNSPRNKNALSKQLLRELEEEVSDINNQSLLEAEAWKERSPNTPIGSGIRAVVFASDVDDVFCAGADLKERATMSSKEYVPFLEQQEALITLMKSLNAVYHRQLSKRFANPLTRVNAFLTQLRGTFDMIANMPVPSISAISSKALGGGFELALATTFRVFTHTTLVGLPETRLGIIPGAGGTYRLQQLLTKSRALNILLTGRKVSGLQAYHMGLCDCLAHDPSVPEQHRHIIKDTVLRPLVLNEALIMAHKICQGAPASTMALMQMMKAGANAKSEAEAYKGLLETADRDEALRAFGEKRKPEFTGRFKGAQDEMGETAESDASAAEDGPLHGNSERQATVIAR
ncbi:MAG: hypothetical protein Q9218_008132 [Villophora microphyllina]